MIAQHATPPRFGTTPIQEGDDLFSLREQTCADCGALFETSRAAARCALCASLRSGQVGPATVLCPICGIEHQIPVLAPHKLCPVCVADPELCQANIAADLQRAEDAYTDTLIAIEHVANDTTDADHERYNTAVEARRTGKIAGRQYSAAQIAASWARSLQAGDGLSPLLAAHDQREAARAELIRVQEWASLARAAVEEATRS